MRAIAVLSVVIYHAFPSLLRGGFVGVDVFFVISGFLISALIFKAIEADRFSFAQFYGRRIRRILPALTVVVAASLAFGWFALLPNKYAELGKQAAGAAGFIVNLVFAKEAGYFDTASALKPLQHLWSLSVEEQFYLLWPMLLLVAWKKGLRLVGLILCLVLFSFLDNIAHIASEPAKTFFDLRSRFWELGIGGMLAYAMMHLDLDRVDAWLAHLIFEPRSTRRRPTFTIADIKSAVGIVLILIAIVSPIPESRFPGWWALYPTIGATLVIWSGPRAWVNKALLSRPAAVFVGLISYPLYLWHWPLLSFVRITESGAPRALIYIAILLSFPLAWLTYAFIERPIRTRRSGAALPAAWC